MWESCLRVHKYSVKLINSSISRANTENNNPNSTTAFETRTRKVNGHNDKGLAMPSEFMTDMPLVISRTMSGRSLPSPLFPIFVPIYRRVWKPFVSTILWTGSIYSWWFVDDVLVGTSSSIEFCEETKIGWKRVWLFITLSIGREHCCIGSSSLGILPIRSNKRIRQVEHFAVQVNRKSVSLAEVGSTRGEAQKSSFHSYYQGEYYDFPGKAMGFICAASGRKKIAENTLFRHDLVFVNN